MQETEQQVKTKIRTALLSAALTLAGVVVPIAFWLVATVVSDQTLSEKWVVAGFLALGVSLLPFIVYAMRRWG